MECNNLVRLRAALKQGAKKLVYVQDKFEVNRVLLAVTSRDFHAAVRPRLGASAQSSLPLVDRRKPLSLPPSISASFHVCGHHTDCLIQPVKTPSEFNVQYTIMAAFSLFDLSLKKSASSSTQLGAPARTFLSSCNRTFHSCTTVRMSLENKEHADKFTLCGYCLYNVAKRSGINTPCQGVRYNDFHTSPDVSLDNSLMDNPPSTSTDSVEQKIHTDRILKLNSGSCYLPHPEKEEKGGEDAHFICADKHVIGVADGVGGWSDRGIDAGQYARELMSNSVQAIQEDPTCSTDPARVLEKAYASTRAKGSATACIIALTDQGLHAINLGDSGFMVVRDGCIVFRSSAQQHDFNFTYQLECEHGGDLPSSGEVFKIPVAPGDVIIAGTDGLFDNLYNNDITALVVQAVRARFGPQVTAQKIAALARQRAQDKNRQTPFSSAAQVAGFLYYGGKLDDITVVVSYISCDHSETCSTRQ